MSSPVLDIAGLTAEVIARAARAGRRPVVGIDGPGGTGKSTLARRIAQAAPGSVVVHVDDFYLPTARRPAQDGIARDVDLPRLRDQVLRPGARGLPGRYQRYDWPTDRLAEWIEVPATGMLIAEGVYCLRPALREFYSYRIFCAAHRAIRLRRGLDRDGEAARSRWQDEWMPAEDRYLSTEDPAAAADLVVDTSADTFRAETS